MDVNSYHICLIAFEKIFNNKHYEKLKQLKAKNKKIILLGKLHDYYYHLSIIFYIENIILLIFVNVTFI